jgi:outer membrane protein OmpA-like peptidoglycan-associated protein
VAPMPPIPSAPPPPPNLPGVPTVIAASPPPVAPPTPPPAAVAVSTAAVSVPFAGGSATLSPAAQGALKQLAQRRGKAVVAVTGYGEAASSEAPDQAAALPLAWSRAQAMAGALQSDGVPPAVLRVTAEAGGRGGVAALAD